MLLTEEIYFVLGIVITFTETVSLLDTEKEAILFTDSSINE